MSVQSGESYRFEQEVYFDCHLYGSVGGYVFGGEIEIRRGTDGMYWDGVEFVETPIWLSTTEDTSGLFHYYDFIIPVSLSGSVYNMRMRVKDDQNTESVGALQVRPAASGGGGGSGGSEYIAVFDAVDFVTGFGSTIQRV